MAEVGLEMDGDGPAVPSKKVAGPPGMVAGEEAKDADLDDLESRLKNIWPASMINNIKFLYWIKNSSICTCSITCNYNKNFRF